MRYINKHNISSGRLLLHTCCIACGASVAELLKSEGYCVTLYFCNPNIYPKEEYDKRLLETIEAAQELELPLLFSQDDHDLWLSKIKGLEKEPERGRRCLICYRDRLERTAKKAKEKGFDFFATTLTVSPHKDAGKIIASGLKLEKEYGVKFLDRDFKKQDGFKKSVSRARELGLYRQNYCGCEFSRGETGVIQQGNTC